MAIPIVDLFAGPGGLGEGFTSLVDNNNNRFFKIVLSIECDEHAHQTLTLRSFIRQFPYKQLPKEYYQFLRGEIKNIEDLYSLYPTESARAKKEAWKVELGSKKPDAIPNTIIDRRIKEALNGEKNFLLIGGPPCQAYSLVGRARRKQSSGLNKDDPRVYLYREYYRILAKHRPAVFIMENVKGILSSKVENENVFKQIINDLEDPIKAYNKLQGKEKFYKSKINYKIYSLVKAPSYLDLFKQDLYFEPKDFVIKAEEYGIPQTRHRVILLGIRSDIDIIPEILTPAESQIPIDFVLTGLPALRSGLSKMKDGNYEWKNVLESIKNTPLNKEVDINVWKKMTEVIDGIQLPPNDRGNSFIKYHESINYNADWFLDNNLQGVCNHKTRSHIELDIYRYLFVSCFAKVHNRSPKLSDFPISLLPKHKNIREKKFADRFRVQMYGVPSKTVTSHISKDGHYFIHPDSAQSRSLTVREAARVQTFPDNYFFCGPRTQQYHQVGNAVPPLLAKQIAEIVSALF